MKFFNLIMKFFISVYCENYFILLGNYSFTELNNMSIRKMLRPVNTAPDSPVTSPENARHHNSAVQL